QHRHVRMRHQRVDHRSSVLRCPIPIRRNTFHRAFRLRHDLARQRRSRRCLCGCHGAAAKSLMWALPEAHSVPKKGPMPWNAAEPYKGLGFRDVEALVRDGRYEIEELSVSKG